MDGGNFNMNMVALADTGQWRMIVTVSFSGISAILRNVMYPGVNPVPLFRKDWVADESNILDFVEAAVYDNPRLLDDFSTQILIYTAKSLWIPAELTEDEEYDEKFFTSVYPSRPEDIFADFGDKEVCLYTLAPGLNSFFQRTLPGCKIASHISILKREFQKSELSFSHDFSNVVPFETIYINCRREDADFFAFQNGNFLSGVTHRWKSFSDLVYWALLLCKVYDLDPEEMRIVLLGDSSITAGIGTAFSSFFLNVQEIRLPLISENYNLPLAAAIAAGDNIRFE